MRTKSNARILVAVAMSRKCVFEILSQIKSRTGLNPGTTIIKNSRVLGAQKRVIYSDVTDVQSYPAHLVQADCLPSILKDQV